MCSMYIYKCPLNTSSTFIQIKEIVSIYIDVIDYFYDIYSLTLFPFYMQLSIAQ